MMEAAGCRLIARTFLFALSIIILNAGGSIAADAIRTPYALGYFGEPIEGLNEQQKAQFERGLMLFTKKWDDTQSFAHNAVSCVECHSVPAPGGSGMSANALVPSRIQNKKTEIGQRYSSGETVAHADMLPNVRRTPSLFGLGLLEGAYMSLGEGRDESMFGALGEVGLLKLMVAKALAIELGVSSSLHCARKNSQEPYPSKCSHNITDNQLDDLVAFVRYLAAPPRKNNPNFGVGQQLFNTLGCDSCHRPILFTSSNASDPIRMQRLEAYTDLKKHDLGDGYSVKTTPLWGVNSFGPPYMHNGKAGSLHEAILLHEGKASNIKRLYEGLSTVEKNAIIEFLKDL